MIASLPMYDLPPLRAANDRFWQAIKTHLGQGPDTLCREGDLWDHWLSPDLLLSQTCGYPYRAHLHDKVGLVGTPDYGLEGCPPGHYCSVFVVRRDDPRGTLADFATERFAYNEPLSQSGWAAPLHHVRHLGFAFQNIVQTGAHRLSALAVAEEMADIAAIDALTWEMLTTYEAFPNDLKVMARTKPTPVLPYITAQTRDTAPLFAAIAAAILELSDEDRAALHIKSVVSLPAESYLNVPTPPPPGG